MHTAIPNFNYRIKLIEIFGDIKSTKGGKYNITLYFMRENSTDCIYFRIQLKHAS